MGHPFTFTARNTDERKAAAASVWYKTPELGTCGA
jgi:hypothetical protein